ncbi:MAG: rRNA maturation RNase YbeY [Actinomycetota bacterium]|nr:rRNA maturation RNase YbeY [Actinomycetota bacterium]
MSIEVLNESGSEADVTGLGRLARYVLDRMRIHPQAELTLRLVDPDTIASYNQRWMDKVGPTDVLAFPMDELRPGSDGDEYEEGVIGDILLCPQVAADQAPANGQTPQQEVDLLTIHGILHLLGYDHAEPDERREMFALQARLLAEWQDPRRDDAVREGKA